MQQLTQGHFLTGGLRPAGPPFAVARGAPRSLLRSRGSLAPLVRFLLSPGRLRPAGPPFAVARGAPRSPLRSRGPLAPLVRFLLSPGRLRPAGPLSRSLAGPHDPRSAPAALSLRSFASFSYSLSPRPTSSRRTPFAVARGPTPRRSRGSLAALVRFVSFRPWRPAIEQSPNLA
jgi:hypothetical protein